MLTATEAFGGPIGDDVIGREVIRSNVRSVLHSFKRRRFRKMAQFATEEIIIPTGQYEGRRLDLVRQPFLKHFYDCVDSDKWSEFVAVGPSQSGKSLGCFVVPIMYYLFERQESVIAAVPDGEMIRDKWEEAILPVIERTRYREYLPRTGKGSKGGRSLAIRFLNGVTLRWMTAGGSDKSRAHYTARVICFTETDGFDESFTTSDEGTKIAQIEARARSYPEAQRRIFKECTVSRDSKHSWVKYTSQSTSSQLLLPCPHCNEFVLPGREHLVGWQTAQTEHDARKNTLFACPECGELWSERQRRAANKSIKMVHGNQSVANGVVIGDMPTTRTLGFRWSAVHNNFLPAGDFGVEEWRAPRSKQPDLEERKLRQFVWALPVTDDLEAIDLSSDTVIKRVDPLLTKGVIPKDNESLGLGVDCGKRLLHWTLTSRRPSSWHVVDYGRIEVPSDDIPIARALVIAFNELADSINALSVPFSQACVDIRYLPEEVLAAIASLGDKRWIGHIGLGDNHYITRGSRYRQPEQKTKAVRYIGTRWYLKRREKGKREVVAHSDACYWKGVVQRGFATSDHDEAITLYESTDKNEHVTYGKHITAEREEIEFEPGKGHIRKWVTLSRSNHLLDSTYMSLVSHKVHKEKPRPRVVKHRRVVR